MHFSVLVIGDDVEKQLAPFQQNNMGKCPKEYLEFIPETELEEVDEKYKWHLEYHQKQVDEEFFSMKCPKDHYSSTSDKPIKEKVCPNCKTELIDTHDSELARRQEALEKIKSQTPMDWAKEYYNDYEFREGIGWGYMENPNAKWDWYQVGGRNSGAFKLKEGANGKAGTPSLLGLMHKGAVQEYEEHMKGRADQAMKKDIDFTPEEKYLQKARRFWEVYVEGKEPECDEEKWLTKIERTPKEVFIKKYGDKESYAKRRAEFETYAVLKDGVWTEVDEYADGEWPESYVKMWIDDLPEDTLLTVVDCHM